MSLKREDREKFRNMIVRRHLSRVRGVEVSDKVKEAIKRDLDRLNHCYRIDDAEKLLKEIECWR